MKRRSTYKDEVQSLETETTITANWCHFASQMKMQSVCEHLIQPGSLTGGRRMFDDRGHIINYFQEVLKTQIIEIESQIKLRSVSSFLF